MKLNECVAVNCEMTLTILCIQNAIKSLIMFYHRGAQAENVLFLHILRKMLITKLHYSASPRPRPDCNHMY